MDKPKHKTNVKKQVKNDYRWGIFYDKPWRGKAGKNISVEKFDLR